MASEIRTKDNSEENKLHRNVRKPVAGTGRNRRVKVVKPGSPTKPPLMRDNRTVQTEPEAKKGGATLSTPPSRETSSRPPLTLKTKTSVAVYSHAPCSDCGKSSTILYAYKKSNWGDVRICDHCNTAALERTYGKIDAMERTR